MNKSIGMELISQMANEVRNLGEFHIANQPQILSNLEALIKVARMKIE